MATVPSGADNSDTAYMAFKFAVSDARSRFLADTMSIAAQQNLQGNLSVLQVRDARGAILYELYVDRNRILHVYSPPHALNGPGINASTNVPVGSRPTRVAVSASTNGSLAVCVHGRRVISLGGLSGGASAARARIRVGIDHYDAGSQADRIRVVHSRLTVGASGPCASAVRHPRPTAPRTGGAPLDLDFENGVWPGRWPGLDSWAPAASSTIDLRTGNENRNFHLVQEPVLRSWGRFAAYFEMQPTDKVADGRYAVLLNGGRSGERAGEDYWYALAFYFPSSVSLNGETLWEIHDPYATYSLPLPGTGAPIVIGVNRSEILGLPGPSRLKLITTLYVGDGTRGGKPVGWRPRTFVLGDLVHDRWVKFLVHVRFAEGSAGRYQVWLDSASDQARARFSARPEAVYAGSTVKWTSAPVNAGGRTVPPLHGLVNFETLGIYRWAVPPGSTQAYYTMGVRRRSSRAAALAAFGP